MRRAVRASVALHVGVVRLHGSSLATVARNCTRFSDGEVGGHTGRATRSR